MPSAWFCMHGRFCRFDVRVIVCECGTVVTVVADRYNWYFRCHVGPLDNLFIK